MNQETFLIGLFILSAYHVLSALIVSIISKKDATTAQWIADAPSRLVSAFAVWLWPLLILARFRVRIESASQGNDDV